MGVKLIRVVDASVVTPVKDAIHFARDFARPPY